MKNPSVDLLVPAFCRYKGEVNNDTEKANDGTVDDAPADVASPVDDGEDAEVKKEPVKEAPVPSVTQDDITKIIVQKIKQNHSNNEKIGQILKTYGVSKVSELPADKYEAFVTDLSAI